LKFKKKFIFITALSVVLLASACGANSNNGTGNQINTPSNTIEALPPNDDQGNNAASDEEILIIIDQTEKPSEGNSFDIGVNKLPEGYALAEMQWVSKGNLIVNSVQEAIEHGANGEDGFYISGNGQYMGFIFPDTMKGEQGTVVFLFTDSQGKELTWKKQITLN